MNLIEILLSVKILHLPIIFYPIIALMLSLANLGLYKAFAPQGVFEKAPKLFEDRFMEVCEEPSWLINSFYSGLFACYPCMGTIWGGLFYSILFAITSNSFWFLIQWQFYLSIPLSCLSISGCSVLINRLSLKFEKSPKQSLKELIDKKKSLEQDLKDCDLEEFLK